MAAKIEPAKRRTIPRAILSAITAERRSATGRMQAYKLNEYKKHHKIVHVNYRITQ